RFNPVHQAGMEIVRHLKKGHSQFMFKLTDCIAKFLKRLFNVLKSFKMTYRLRYFREKFEVFRGFCSPGSSLAFIRRFIEGGIKLNRIKLCSVIAELILGAAWVEVFKICFVPFGTAYIDFKRRLVILIFCQYFACVGMVFRQSKIHIFGMVNLSKFHSLSIKVCSKGPKIFL